MHVEALQVHAAGLCGVSVLMTLGLLVSSYVTEAYMYYEPIGHTSFITRKDVNKAF
jgi:hypothetical protein